MSLPSLARLFVKINPPRFAIPKGGKRVAARIARDFVEFVGGVTDGFNEAHGTSLTPAQGLAWILDQNIDPASLFDKYRSLAELGRTHVVLRNWAGEKAFTNGWRWLNGDFAKWFVWHALGSRYEIDEFHGFPGAPDLRKVILEHRNGEIWMEGFMVALRGFLYPAHAEDVEAKGQSTEVKTGDSYMSGQLGH